LVGLGFELRALSLQSRYLTTGGTLQSIFALVILQKGSLKLFAQVGLESQSSDLILPSS
jgi:hypothetical protein